MPTREDLKLSIPCSQELVLLLLDGNVAQKPRQQRPVNRAIISRLLVEAHPLLARQEQDLAMDIPPLAHAQEVQEPFAAPLLELIRG